MRLSAWVIAVRARIASVIRLAIFSASSEACGSTQLHAGSAVGWRRVIS
jgi:hypothetical protein